MRISCIRSTPGLLFLCLAVGAGCGGWDAPYPTSPGEDALVVHGLLREGAAEHEILVERTRELRDGFYRGHTPVSGAVVSVSGPDGTRTFTEDPAQPGVYRAAFPVQGGASYVLRVTSPGGNHVRGQTQVPTSIRLNVPAADTTVQHRDIPQVAFHWTSSTYAGGYKVVPSVPGRSTGMNDLPLGGGIPDTTVVVDIALESILYGFAKEIRYSVAAVDANYRHYYAVGDSAGTSRTTDRIRSTVEGGYGLFGSYTLSNTRSVKIQ
jgi:hypothetical protein